MATEPKDYTAIAIKYCQDVVTLKRLANKWTRLACQRFLDDLNATEDPTSMYRYDPEKAAKVCRFCESLRHVKGVWAKERRTITLEPWQVAIVAPLFGFVHRDSGLRRFREAMVLIPRKCAKTTLAAMLSLWMLTADHEEGADVFCGATTLRQSMEVFDCARRMVELSPGLKKAFGIEIWKKSLLIGSTGSKMMPLVRDPGEGSSPHFFVADEVHQHDNDTLISAMRTGTGARRQPMGLYISTSGFDLDGPLYQMQKDAEKILDKLVQDDSFYAIVYGIDADTDPFSIEALHMANPNINVSIFESDLRAVQLKARDNARLTNEFLTKRLNVWVLGSTSWVNLAAWNKLADKTLTMEQFQGCEAFMALDASSKLDMTALVTVFKKEISGQTHYFAFPKLYLPAERINDPQLQHYKTWEQQGFLRATPGNIVDLDFIAQEAIADIKQFHIGTFCYDPWNSAMFAGQVSSETPATAIEIPQQVKYLSDPMKNTEALIIAGRLHHPDNACYTWNFSNVVCHQDAKGNVYPRKDNVGAKIDGAVATIMCMSRAALKTVEKKKLFVPFFI